MNEHTRRQITARIEYDTTQGVTLTELADRITIKDAALVEQIRLRAHELSGGCTTALHLLDVVDAAATRRGVLDQQIKDGGGCEAASGVLDWVRVRSASMYAEAILEAWLGGLAMSRAVSEAQRHARGVDYAESGDLVVDAWVGAEAEGTCVVAVLLPHRWVGAL